MISTLKKSWENCNQTTIEFAKNIPAKLWSEKPFDPRFKSFAWEFACLVRTRMCYLKAFKTGELLFSEQEDVTSKETLNRSSRDRILKYLLVLGKEISQKIQKLASEEELNLIIWLIQHERLHHGKLMLYFSKAELRLPNLLIKTWGKTNFPLKTKK